MMIRAALLASLLVFTASLASAELTFTTETTVTGNRALSALEVGDTVVIDITMVSDGEETLGVGASAADYDASVIRYLDGSGLVSPNPVLNSVCIPATGCFGGIPNLETTAGLIETSVNAPSEFVRFLTAVTLTATTGTGEFDEGVVTGVFGDAQFQLTFEALAEGTTTIVVGALSTFGDEASGPGAVAVTVNNFPLAITVPEPGEVASSLAALGSVFAVIAIRRRF